MGLKILTSAISRVAEKPKPRTIFIFGGLQTVIGISFSNEKVISGGLKSIISISSPARSPTILAKSVLEHIE